MLVAIAFQFLAHELASLVAPKSHDLELPQSGAKLVNQHLAVKRSLRLGLEEKCPLEACGLVHNEQEHAGSTNSSRFDRADVHHQHFERLRLPLCNSHMSHPLGLSLNARNTLVGGQPFCI
ncbi:hypothetical protein PF008_g30639 [Phytophthora fragariae]|uniref:Secreted protein n=1 Tax=Phytophthora fragariae TaxID=53985 RepID=A0A6G0Q527_9STRA|nr:hypothetical protein PF008_g30639 [Phytophthora fragariae]